MPDVRSHISLSAVIYRDIVAKLGYIDREPNVLRACSTPARLRI